MGHRAGAPAGGSAHSAHLTSRGLGPLSLRTFRWLPGARAGNRDPWSQQTWPLLFMGPQTMERQMFRHPGDVCSPRVGRGPLPPRDPSSALCSPSGACPTLISEPGTSALFCLDGALERLMMGWGRGGVSKSWAPPHVQLLLPIACSTRLPCPSLSPRVCSHSCPLSQR